MVSDQQVLTFIFVLFVIIISVAFIFFALLDGREFILAEVDPIVQIQSVTTGNYLIPRSTTLDGVTDTYVSADGIHTDTSSYWVRILNTGGLAETYQNVSTGLIITFDDIDNGEKFTVDMKYFICHPTLLALLF